MPYLTISPSEWAALLGAGGVFATAVIGAIAAAAVKIIGALRANTADRAATAQVTNTQLVEIAANTPGAKVTIPPDATGNP